LVSLALPSLLLAACGGDSAKVTPDAGRPDAGPPVLGEGCNALGGTDCLLPWPSSIYEKDDAASATGHRLDIPDGVLPHNNLGVHVSPARYNKMDGWSANIPLLMAWDVGFDPAPLPKATEPGASLEAGSPTVIVDLESGARVAHFAEEDLEAKDLAFAPPDQVALIIRPLIRLTPGHRYAVGIRKSLKAADGSELPLGAGFQALVDGKASGNDRIERVRPEYATIFAKLEAAGVAKADLVVAWAFTVRSDAEVTADLLNGRDAMLAAIGPTAAGFTYTVQSDMPGENADLAARVVKGTFEVPNLLTGEGGDDAVLFRDANGKVAVNPEHPKIAAPFAVVIPKCAETATLPLPIVVFGHGLLGSIEESQRGYVPYFANRECYAIVATEWRGMSSRDLNIVGGALSDLETVDLIMEKLVQGVNQFVALETIVRLAWANDPLFTQVRGKGAAQPLLDPTKMYFYGISQGSIFGGTFMAIDPYIEYGTMGVPASNFSLIIERSTNWGVYRSFIYRGYADNSIDPQILLTLAQTRWDLSDSISYVGHLAGDAEHPLLPGVEKKKHILMQMSFGDSSVNNLGAELWARTAGFKVLAPALYTPFELETAPGPLDSALTQWDEHRLPRPPGGNVTPDENGTHGTLRLRDRINDQIQDFFSTGKVSPTCKMGETVVACDCTTAEICGPPHF
jgi:hypothetical protein